MRVAIAGYGDLTRYICEEFVKAGHELVVLTRSRKPQLDDYGNPLIDCDALISTISDISSAYTDVHRNLILACQESPRCKRFVPAEFAANIEAYPDQPGFSYVPHEPIRKMLRDQKDLEWTLVCIGWLADYFVPARNRHIKDIGQFHPVNWEDENRNVMPGTGSEPVDFTWARDVVQGLAALVNAPMGSWEPYTFMSGERSCWNDAVKRVKEKHRPQMQIQHVSLHSIVEMVKTAKDQNTLELADYYLLAISQACAMPADQVLTHREKYFPQVRFRTLQEGLSHFDQHPSSAL